MPTMGFGQAGDHRPQRQLRQPDGGPAAQDSVAKGAFAGDHQDTTLTAFEGLGDEFGEDGARPIMIQAMKIESGADGFAASGHAPIASRFDRLRRSAPSRSGRKPIRYRCASLNEGADLRRRRAAARQGADGRGDDRPRPQVFIAQGHFGVRAQTVSE